MEWDERAKRQAGGVGGGGDFSRVVLAYALISLRETNKPTVGQAVCGVLLAPSWGLTEACLGVDSSARF